MSLCCPHPKWVEAEMVCWRKVARAADVPCHSPTAIRSALMPTISVTPCNRPSAHARSSGLGRVLSQTTYLAQICPGRPVGTRCHQCVNHWESARIWRLRGIGNGAGCSTRCQTGYSKKWERYKPRLDRWGGRYYKESA